MTDQIAFFQRKDHVRENSQHVVTATFRDRATAANVTPTNVRYRIDDLTCGAVILDWTSVSTDDVVSITVTPAQNALRSQSNREEVRQITVAADYGLSTQYMDAVTYELQNTLGVS